MNGTESGVDVVEVVRYQLVRWTRYVKGGKPKLMIDRVPKEYDKHSEAIDARADLLRRMAQK